MKAFFLLLFFCTSFCFAHNALIKRHDGIKRDLRDDEWYLALYRLKDNKKINKLPQSSIYLKDYEQILLNKKFIMAKWLNLGDRHEYLFAIVKENNKFIRIWIENDEQIAGEYFN